MQNHEKTRHAVQDGRALVLRASKSRQYREQASPLLRLPAEVRNAIYIYVAHSQSDYTFQAGRLGEHRIQQPPPTRVCRQLKSEYQGVYEAKVPRAATHFVVHLTNFIAPDQRNRLENHIPQPFPGVTRTFTFKIFINNMLDQYAYDVRCFMLADKPWWINNRQRVQTSVKVSFDGKALDVHFCRQVLEKMNHTFGTERWGPVREAFEEMVRTAELEKERKRLEKRKKWIEASGGRMVKRARKR